MRRHELFTIALLTCLLAACGDDDASEGSPDAKGRDGGPRDATIADASVEGDAADSDATPADGAAPDGDAATAEDGATDGDAATGGDGGLPLDEYATRIAPAYCELYVGCCSEDELFGLFRSNIRSRAQCVSALMDTLTGNLQSSKESGGIDFDEDAAADCLATLANLGCERFSQEVHRNELCAGVLDPQLNNGAKCDDSIECISGVCHEGICRSAGDEGDACGGADPRCEEGLLCVQRMCTPKLDNEGECTSGGQCISNYCGPSGVCMDGPVICNGNGPSPR